MVNCLCSVEELKRDRLYFKDNFIFFFFFFSNLCYFVILVKSCLMVKSAEKKSMLTGCYRVLNDERDEN